MAAHGRRKWSAAVSAQSDAQEIRIVCRSDFGCIAASLKPSLRFGYNLPARRKAIPRTPGPN
jgi:hypothetical protein